MNFIAMKNIEAISVEPYLSIRSGVIVSGELGKLRRCANSTDINYVRINGHLLATSSGPIDSLMGQMIDIISLADLGMRTYKLSLLVKENAHDSFQEFSYAFFALLSDYNGKKKKTIS